MAEEAKPQVIEKDPSAEDMVIEPDAPISDGGKRKRDDADESENQNEGENGSGLKVPVNLGYKSFATSVEMFDYFFAFLHSWSPNININKVSTIFLPYFMYI